MSVTTELATHEVYIPDLAGWRISKVPERPRGEIVRIAPDWVCEILSPSSAARDLGHKLDTYHRAGVAHYWIADPEHRIITIYRWQERGYLHARTAGSGLVRAEPFDAIELDLAAVFGEGE